MNYTHTATFYNKLTKREETFSFRSIYSSAAAAAQALCETNHGVYRVVSVSDLPEQPVVALEQDALHGRIWHNRTRLLQWLAKDNADSVVETFETELSHSGHCLLNGVVYMDLEFYKEINQQLPTHGEL